MPLNDRKRLLNAEVHAAFLADFWEELRPMRPLTPETPTRERHAILSDRLQLGLSHPTLSDALSATTRRATRSTIEEIVRKVFKQEPDRFRFGPDKSYHLDDLFTPDPPEINLVTVSPPLPPEPETSEPPRPFGLLVGVGVLLVLALIAGFYVRSAHGPDLVALAVAHDPDEEPERAIADSNELLRKIQGDTSSSSDLFRAMAFQTIGEAKLHEGHSIHDGQARINDFKEAYANFSKAKEWCRSHEEDVRRALITDDVAFLDLAILGHGVSGTDVGLPPTSLAKDAEDAEGQAKNISDQALLSDPWLVKRATKGSKPVADDLRKFLTAQSLVMAANALFTDYELTGFTNRKEALRSVGFLNTAAATFGSYPVTSDNYWINREFVRVTSNQMIVQGTVLYAANRSKSGKDLRDLESFVKSEFDQAKRVCEAMAKLGGKIGTAETAILYEGRATVYKFEENYPKAANCLLAAICAIPVGESAAIQGEELMALADVEINAKNPVKAVTDLIYADWLVPHRSSDSSHDGAYFRSVLASAVSEAKKQTKDPAAIDKIITNGLAKPKRAREDEYSIFRLNAFHDLTEI